MKRVIISGASSGIGYATALKFAENGCQVHLLCDRNVEGLVQLKSEIEQRYGAGRAYTYRVDITREAKVQDFISNLAREGNIPDIIINNAGISHIGLLQDLPEQDWNAILAVNLSGLYHICHAALPYMIERGCGRIINVSSMWGNVGASCEVAYSASKGGVNSFTKALAKELAPSGIPVNAVAFGCVDTAMNHFLSDEEKRELTADIPAGYFLSPKDAAEVLYTVSTLHPYVTGQIITADGGYT